MQVLQGIGFAQAFFREKVTIRMRKLTIRGSSLQPMTPLCTQYSGGPIETVLKIVRRN